MSIILTWDAEATMENLQFNELSKYEKDRRAQFIAITVACLNGKGKSDDCKPTERDFGYKWKI